MNLSALDLNLLVALEALLSEANVTRAAQRVSLSQPAMSHALKRLRGLFGDPLLVRVGGEMQLTARAEALRSAVADALLRIRALLESETFDPATSTRVFQVFLADNASDLLITPLLERLQREAPNISIQVKVDWRGAFDTAELARVVDAAVACVPNVFKGFFRQHLFTDRDACAVRRGHPLAAEIRHPDRFLRMRHVAVVGREFTEDPVDTWLRQEGRPRRVALTVPHYLHALHVVAESDLVAVLPERLIRTHAAVLGLDVRAVPLDVGTFDEYLLHPARTHTESGNVWLRRVLKDVATSLGPLDAADRTSSRQRRRRRVRA